jgi:predicted Holliday junction resolvase-like endonuclease
MLEMLVVILLVALVGSIIFQYLSNRKDKTQLQEYKQLFDLADGEQKKSQGKVEELLRAIAAKDLLIDRAAQSFELSQQRSTQTNEELAGLRTALSFQEEQYDKLLNQKKSSEVRTGKITEQIAPFLADYPLSPGTARFLGDPIDFVHFEEDKVTFVEVKSGKSQLNKRQREIRDLVQQGKVEFIIYRVEGKD